MLSGHPTRRRAVSVAMLCDACGSSHVLPSRTLLSSRHWGTPQRRRMQRSAAGQTKACIRIFSPDVRP